MTSSVPELVVGGIKINPALFTAAWEDEDGGNTGVSLKSSWNHEGHGATFFFADPEADKLRHAFGDQVMKTVPANMKGLPLR